MKNHLLLLKKTTAVSKLQSIIKNDDLCYLLSKDYMLYLKINKTLPIGCRVLNLTGIFQKEFKKINEYCLNIYSKLNKANKSVGWWGSHIASRSSTAIPLQLNITYLFCAKKIIENFEKTNNSGRLIFIADSQALLDSISVIAKQKNFIISHPRKNILKYIYFVKSILLFGARIGIFAYRNYRNKRSAIPVLKPISFDHSVKRKRIVIRSWITKDTLNEDGIFTDRNFGELPSWLKSKGYEVMIIPMFFNLDKSQKNIFSQIKNQNFHFLIQEHYLKPIDYFKAILIGLKQSRISLKNITLKSVDLALLFREVQIDKILHVGLMTLNLCYPLMKRLKEKGVEVDTFYYPIENNVPEKLFILGCKKYFPNSYICAYQHSAWYENQMSMFLDENETEFHPIADKIICSGPIYLDVLKKAGFPEDRLVAGPNLRFTSVHKDGSKLKQNIRRPNILLPLTFDNDLAYDLIHKIKLILKDFPELFIYIRRHPLLNQKELTDFLNEIEMSNFQYADEGNMQDWLLNTDIVLSTGGSIVIVETVAMGIPLIRVEPDNNFLLDPLAWTNYTLKPVNTPEEISNSINSILGMEKEEKNKFQEIGSEVLFNYFTEINENTMRVFN